MNLDDMEYWKSLIKMSACKFFILQGLHQGPGHGYALLERMKIYTGGRCTSSYGTVYPILQRLAKEKYAIVKTDNKGPRNRKIYQLTEKGQKAYKEALKAWEGILPYLSRAVDEDLY
jgi:PadR family transcriptional regulator PadR